MGLCLVVVTGNRRMMTLEVVAERKSTEVALEISLLPLV